MKFMTLCKVGPCKPSLFTCASVLYPKSPVLAAVLGRIGRERCTFHMLPNGI